MNIETNIELVDIDKLIPYEKNPRKRNKKSIDKIAFSIREHGFNQPIVIDQQNRICVGNGRYLAAKQNEMKQVPCIRKNMSDKTFKKYLVADNKTNEHSSWEKDLLTELLEDIPEAERYATTFDADEIDSLLESMDEDMDIEQVEVEAHTRTINGPPKVKNKPITIFVDDLHFEKFLQMCETVGEATGLTETGEMAYYAIEKIYDEIQRKG